MHTVTIRSRSIAASQTPRVEKKGHPTLPIAQSNRSPLYNYDTKECTARQTICAPLYFPSRNRLSVLLSRSSFTIESFSPGDRPP
jgi:hypothetical protein